MSDTAMSERNRSADRRLILDLYHGAADVNLLRASAELARFLGLDLHCLFIEDEALLALAELPFAREIRLPAHRWTPIDTISLSDDLRQAAAQTRRRLDDIIRNAGVASAFEVLRGDPAECIAGVCRAGDIVVVVEPGPPVLHGAHRLQAAAYASPASVLLLPVRLKPRAGPVVAVLTHAADPSLAVACRLALAAGEDLAILLPDRDGAAASAAAPDQATGLAIALGLRHDRISVRRIHDTTAENITHALTGLRERLIVMTRSASPASEAPAASRIAADLGVPVLLIETEPAKPAESARRPGGG